MLRWISSCLILLLLLAFCAVEARATEKNGPDGWRQLNGRCLMLEYQPKDELVARKLWPELVKASTTDLSGNKKDILAKAKLMQSTEQQALQFITHMVGLDKPTEGMKKTYENMVDTFYPAVPRFKKFRLCHRSDQGNSKAKKAAGISYDSASDTFSFNMRANPERNITAADYIPIVLAGNVSVEKTIEDATNEIKSVCDTAAEKTPAWLIYHETSESAIVWDYGIYSRFRRWFCDGAAEVIAEMCTRQILGEDSYRQSLVTWGDASQYLPLRGQVDLMNWRAAECEDDLPYQMNNNLRRAHYFFATQEVRGLVERHGPEAIALILQEIKRLDATDSESIYTAINMVTGEDAKARLSAYSSASYDPFRGIATCYTSAGYTETGSQSCQMIKTSSIPLILDGKHCIALQFGFGFINPPVTALVQLIDQNGKSITKSVQIDSKAGRCTLQFEETSILKPGNYMLSLSFDNRIYKEIPIRLTDPDIKPSN